VIYNKIKIIFLADIFEWVQKYFNESIIRISIIQTVKYTNTRISKVAHANVQKCIIMPLNDLFTAILCLIIWMF